MLWGFGFGDAQYETLNRVGLGDPFGFVMVRVELFGSGSRLPLRPVCGLGSMEGTGPVAITQGDLGLRGEARAVGVRR